MKKKDKKYEEKGGSGGLAIVLAILLILLFVIGFLIFRIMNLKNAIISCQILDTQQQLKFAHGSEAKDLLLQLQQLFETRKEIARFIGERVVNPRIRH